MVLHGMKGRFITKIDRQSIKQSSNHAIAYMMSTAVALKTWLWEYFTFWGGWLPVESSAFSQP